MIKLAMMGASGRMGQQILRLAAKDSRFTIVGALESPGSDALGKTVGQLIGVDGLDARVTSRADQALKQASVAIDFSSPQATLANIKEAARLKCGLVIGTTGFTDAQKKKIKEYAKQIPIVLAPNMSLGVNVLFKMATLVAGLLDNYTIEIVEVHHKHKKDAPSGTALELANKAAEGRGTKLKTELVIGENGKKEAAKKGVIRIHAFREGEVVGDHTVTFQTEGERVELVHRASSRDAFAYGAIQAAAFLSKQKRGFFTMQDVLGLS